jgi:hypothetical protein
MRRHLTIDRLDDRANSERYVIGGVNGENPFDVPEGSGKV